MAKFTGELTGSLIFSDQSGGVTSIVPGSDSLNMTGSVNITGSRLTFNGSDVIQRIVNLEAGGGGDLSLGALNNLTGSLIANDSASMNRLDALEAATSSYLTEVPSGTISSSIQVDYGSISNVPGGIISGSSQISALGFVTESGDNTPAGTVSSSAQIEEFGFITSSSDIDTGSFAITGSNRFVGTQYISGALIPEALSSENGLHDLGSLSKPWRDLYITTGSLNFVKDGTLISALNGEKDAIRVGNILITTASISVVSGTGDNLTVEQTVVEATVSSSGEVTQTNQVTAPAGTISSSAQISAFGFLTSETDSQTLSVSGDQLTISGGNTVSLPTGGGGVTSFNDLSDVPSGLVSSSAQVDFDNLDNVPDGLVSSSDQIAYNGDRTISNDKLGDLYTDNFNAGTSGSVIDFLNAVFFPNNAPIINSEQFSVHEFENVGTVVGSISATDPDGDTLTFATASSYTDNKFAVSSAGQITVATKTTASINTDSSVNSNGAHPVPVTATDPYGAQASKTLHIRVTPNTAPKFRETSVSGNIITTVSVNLNENSTDNTLVKRIYFSDDESDTITITTSSVSPANHFDFTIAANYVDVRQNTASLDYETHTSYTMSITASDAHAVAGDDAEAVTTIPITVNVVDNLVPTINNQSLSGVNENSNDGTSAGSISASDNEGDTITFSNFTLTKLELNNADVALGTYGGTSQASDPHENAFQMNSSGVVTRRPGVYLNSDLVDEYQYSVQVTDSFNTASNSATITIPVQDDPAPSITPNGTFYIIESAESGSLIRTNSNGRTGTQARVTSNQSVTWSSPSSLVAINSSGYLTIEAHVSGAYSGSQTFTADVTASNSFGTENATTLTFNVANNSAPSVTYSDAALDTNSATNGATAGTFSITDTENDSPYELTIAGSDASKFSVSPTNAVSSSWNLLINTSSLPQATYSITATATDSYGKATTINASPVITQSVDYGVIYIWTSTRTGGGTLSASNYNGIMGISTVNSNVPPTVTGFTADAASPMKLLKEGGMASSSLSPTGGAMSRRAALSGSASPTAALSALSSFAGDGSTQEQIIIAIPSGSDLNGMPTSMAQAFGGSTEGEYVLNVNDAGTFANTISAATIHELTLDTAHEGFTDWFIIGRQGTNTASSFALRLTPSSGSAP